MPELLMPALALALALVLVLVLVLVLMLVLMLVHVVALWPCGSGAGLTGCLGNCTMRHGKHRNHRAYQKMPSMTIKAEQRNRLRQQIEDSNCSASETASRCEKARQRHGITNTEAKSVRRTRTTPRRQRRKFCSVSTRKYQA